MLQLLHFYDLRKIRMISDGDEMTNDQFTSFPRGIRINLDPKVKKKLNCHKYSKFGTETNSILQASAAHGT